MRLYADYHKPTAPRDLMQVVDETAATIKDWLAKDGNSITHLVCTGTSGQSVAWPLSYKLGIPVCVIRKEGEQAHSGKLIGQGELGNYAIIDDFIASGATMRHILGTVEHELSRQGSWTDDKSVAPKCVAIFVYDSARDYGFDHDGAEIPVIGNDNSSREI